MTHSYLFFMQFETIVSRSNLTVLNDGAVHSIIPHQIRASFFVQTRSNINVN